VENLTFPLYRPSFLFYLVCTPCTPMFAIAKENGVELAILQSRSPSCGVKEIYDGTFSGTRIPGQGVFAKMLMDEGIRVLDAGELPEIILKNEDGKCQSN